MSGSGKRKMTLRMIARNRGFFPDHLARSGHREMKAVLEAAKCAALFGTLPNFGDERVIENNTDWNFKDLEEMRRH